MNNVTAASTAESVRTRLRTMALRLDTNGPSGKAGEIVSELERRLITGQYKFGDSLSINRLAEEFEASRQPISAAINHLRGLGYLRIVPQVGCEIVSPSPMEIDDFFYMLGKMESAMAGLAATRYLDDEALVLDALADYVSRTPFDNESQREDWALGVDAYHAQVLAMARSPTLEHRVQNLWRLSDFYLWQGASNFKPASIDISNQQRRAVAGAIAKRDVAFAESLMEQHVRGKPHRVGIV